MAISEIERRVILFKPTTTLPDDSQLGWDADPNTVVNGNSAGESLLYNCPLGNQYIQSTGEHWRKTASPNTWVQSGASLTKGVSTGNVQQVDQAETSVASATSITLGTTLNHLITGTTAIEIINGVAGVTNHCRVETGFDLVHSVSSLACLQTGATITTEAGDTFDVYHATATMAQIRNYVSGSGGGIITDLTVGIGDNF